MGVWQVKRGSMVVFKILKTDSMFIRLILNIQCIIAALVDQYKTFLCTQGIVGNLVHKQTTCHFIRQYYRYHYFDYSIA
jgi:hypothetical protein